MKKIILFVVAVIAISFTTMDQNAIAQVPPDIADISRIRLECRSYFRRASTSSHCSSSEYECRFNQASFLRQFRDFVDACEEIDEILIQQIPEVGSARPTTVVWVSEPPNGIACSINPSLSGLAGRIQEVFQEEGTRLIRCPRSYDLDYSEYANQFTCRRRNLVSTGICRDNSRPGIIELPDSEGAYYCCPR